MEDHEAAVKADPNSKPLKLTVDAESSLDQPSVEYEQPSKELAPKQLSNEKIEESNKKVTSTLNVTDESPKADSSSRKPVSNAKVKHVPGIKKGVQPGSFIDLLVRGSMRDTGELFTYNEKAQQARLQAQVSDWRSCIGTCILARVKMSQDICTRPAYE